MHSLYNFLINPNENATFNPSDPPSPSTFESWLESNYLQYHCDENNWFQGELLVYSTGQLQQLCPKDDYRGRDDLYEEYEKMRPSHRWQRALDNCARCLAYDFNLYGHSGFSLDPDKENGHKIEEMDRVEILSAIEDHIVIRLDDAKKWFTTKASIHNSKTSLDIMNSGYGIQKLLIQTAYLINAREYDHRFRMFSDTHSPYDHYRCMQIEDAEYISKKEDKPPVLCIAMVDIHT